MGPRRAGAPCVCAASLPPSLADMSSWFPLLSVLLLLLPTTAHTFSSSSSSGGAPNYNYDVSGQALTNLYNSPVFLAERVKRPLDNAPWGIMLGPLSHSGVRVTLADGSQYLIHKGDNYGDSSDTVVVRANHMSDKWKVVKTHDFEGTKTVSEFVEDGGSDYSLVFANCHLASRAMMRP